MTTIGLSYSLVKISTKCAPALGADLRIVLITLTVLDGQIQRKPFGHGDRYVYCNS